MKTEVSAGGIILKYTKRVWEVLVLQDMNSVWTFPKGKIEENENLEQAAVREIHEEVGMKSLIMIRKFRPIEYTYTKSGPVKKTVHYFLFQSDGTEHLINQTEEGIHNATWMPIDHALEVIGYPKTNRALLVQVKQWTLHQHPT